MDLDQSRGAPLAVPPKDFRESSPEQGRTDDRGLDPDLSGRRVLVVDDDQAACEVVEAQLKRRKIDVAWRTSAEDALALVAEVDFDAILTDLNMAGMSGLELCERILGTRPDVPVIVVTGYGSMESAVAALRVGAYDYVTKPADPKMLALTISRAIQHRGLRAEVKRLREAVRSQQLGEIVGASAAMNRVYELIARVAESEASVLITGESGTGKELVARALHEQGSRRAGPFLAINCAAVPPSLLESELFGHVKGAFTDARTSRTGLFVQANGGTLFLDEIGELPLDMQPKLLRALQERTVRPVGSNTEVGFNVRVVAATNQDLEAAILDKRFREDLFYRVNVVRVNVPPLRDRGSDVLVLAQHFISKFADRAGRKVVGLSPPAAEKVLSYGWPGNVRELENCIERAVALAHFDQITVEDLPDKIRDYRAERLRTAEENPEGLVSLETVERRHVLRVLEQTGGNKLRAAAILGVDRRTLYRMLRRFEEST
jgi:DNA-binding NtrC family response regulator